MIRKITIISITCFCLLSKTVDAQERFSFGSKVGLSLSSTDTENYKTKLGFVVGGIVDYKLSKYFFFRSGIDFVMKGAKLEEHFLIYYVDIDDNSVLHKKLAPEKRNDNIQLNYLQIPITFGYKMNLNSFSIYANAGSYFAYGIYARGNSSSDQVESIGSLYKYPKKEQKLNGFNNLGFKKFDFGVVASIGVEYKKYFVNLGYEYGLVNSTKKTDNKYIILERFNNPSWHNMTATFTIGYKF